MQNKFYFRFFLIIIFFFSIQSSYALSEKFRIIITSNPSSTMTIAWNQVSGVSPVVYYDIVDHGTNIGNYSNSQTPDRIEVYRGMNNHFVRLTSLTPNTEYYFVIDDSEGNSERFWFRTAPSDNSRLSFIAGGDSRNNRSVRQNANLLVSKLKPHAVFFGGDMINSDNNTEWQEWFEDWQMTISADGRMIPIVPARGNHEDSGSIYNLFDTPIASSYYAMTWGNGLIRTYTLNSEISVTGDQLNWLTNDFNNNSTVLWKMAQYHKPMRPHTAAKSEGSAEYNAWAQLFFDQGVRLVVDCDSHMSKTTHPIEPSSANGNDEGFIQNPAYGTVYTGEGCWGAPLRPNNDDKSWTRNSGSFNQFKLLFLNEDMIEHRTIKVDNAASVAEVSNTDPFTLPAGLDVWVSPSGESLIEILPIGQTGTNCDIAGTPCDDNDGTTNFDEEDGICNCFGIPNDAAELTVAVNATSDDAEQYVLSGIMESLNSSELELTEVNGQDQIVGVRFTNITIPQGATIYRAYIQFTADNTHSGTTDLTVHGELAPNSSTFTTANNDISSRQTTLASTDWNEVSTWNQVGEADLAQRTPHLTDIVTEITKQGGWISGNAITFIISGSGIREAESFDGTAAPVLKIFYDISCPIVGTVCDDADGTTNFDEGDGNCNCFGIPSDAAELTVAVNASSDDVEEIVSSGNMESLTSSDLELINESSGDQIVGVRFTNVTIPQGAIIYRAYIQFTADNTHSGTTNLTIHGEFNPNSSTFTSSNNNVSSRQTTSASASWNDVPAWDVAGEAGLAQRTPYLTNILTEITGQGGWTAGNAMTFIISGSGKREAESFDGTAAPILKVFYENSCLPVATACNDNDANTFFDIEDGVCNCAGIPEVGTQNYTVNSSSDDAEENAVNGNVSITSSDLELISDPQTGNSNQIVGICFRNINLPPSAFITNAYIQFTVDESESISTNLSIRGEKADNSVVFTNSNSNLSNRIMTDEQVSWNNIPAWPTVGENGLNQQTPNLSSIVEEILNESGWQQLNSMSFFFSGSGKRIAESYDGVSASAPQLVLTYSLVQPLPTELAHFTAFQLDQKVELSWVTLSEINNEYFIVERKTGGTDWIEIGRIEGAGFSGNLLEYLFFDEEPLHGTNYYRIKQVGFDGINQYSLVKSVHFEKDVLSIKVHPIPTTDFINVSSSKEIFDLQLYDINGRMVSSSQEQNVIDMTDLQPGVYILRIDTGHRLGEMIFEKVIKNNR